MSILRLVARTKRREGLGPPSWCTNHKRADYFVKLFWATPPWLTAAHRLAMRKTYARAGARNHVDHIVPLKHPLVCGLHVPWNLQILTPQQNQHKYNNSWPDSPGDNHELFDSAEVEPHQTRLAL